MISVLLAAYCGEAFIGEQVASILPQMENGDELLVSDDSPEDQTATRDIVRAFGDPRIRYMQGPRRGVIKNFEYLLGQARGELLVLCDQDDVWLPDKLPQAREFAAMAEQNPALLTHGAILTDKALREIGRSKSSKPGLVRNLVKNTYTGCCMAFTRALLPYILPFPEDIPMHDQWIGLRAEKFATVLSLWEPMLLHRRHGETQTGRGSTLKQKLQWRWRMARALLGRQK